ncbi:unnamed protein product, partial [Prorocentrum cordatum]
MSRFLQEARGRVEFHQASLPHFADSDKPDAILNFGQSLEALIGAVGQISTTEGADFMRLIGPIELSDDARRPVARAECNTFYNYLPSELWGALADQASQYSIVISTVARLRERLGMVHLNETSYTHIASCLYLGARFVNVDALSPTDRQCHWKIKEDLKTNVRALRGRQKRPHWGKVMACPNQMLELQQQNPEIWNL